MPTATAVLGDLIDLAQDNSVRWPEPQPRALAWSGARRHYLRLTAEPHAGLARRVDSLIRRLGLTVQNRASLGAHDRPHLGFLISPGDGAQREAVASTVARLGRVHDLLVLGVAE